MAHHGINIVGPFRKLRVISAYVTTAPAEADSLLLLSVAESRNSSQLLCCRKRLV